MGTLDRSATGSSSWSWRPCFWAWGVGFFLCRAGSGGAGARLLLAAVSSCLGLLLLEGGIRLAVAIHYHFFPPDRSRESYYGWVAQPNLNETREVPGYGLVHFSTGAHGFRRWGDVGTRRRKLLVLGDSYTQAGMVSDGETYYDLLARELPDTEVFAYGCGGYGSLQEYMILDRYLDEIRPELILWQFCSNDVIENSVELEAKSAYNAHMRRPYLRGGRIEWLTPSTDFGFVYNLVQSSYLLRTLCRLQYDAPNARRGSWLEKDYAREGELCAKAAETTRQIMEMVRRRAGRTPIVAFSTSEAPWVGDAYVRACQAARIDYIPGVAAAVEREKARGVAVDAMPIDSHWNARGHAIAGRLILDHLLAREPYSTK